MLYIPSLKYIIQYLSIVMCSPMQKYLLNKAIKIKVTWL